MKKFFASFAVLFFATSYVHAKDTSSLFDVLKQHPADYEIVGQVCEETARLQLYNEYPSSKYQIAVGIEYSVDKRTVGELDVVVVEKATKKIPLIAEVKCWKDVKGGLSKAMDQRSRFIRTLNSKNITIVFLAHEGGAYKSEQFKNAKFVSIAQLGASQKGFDVDLEYTLEELMSVREQLLQCQNRGECKKPQKRNTKTQSELVSALM